MTSREDFETALALRNVDTTIERMEEAIADADGPEVASLMRLLKEEIRDLHSAIEEANKCEA